MRNATACESDDSETMRVENESRVGRKRGDRERNRVEGRSRGPEGLADGREDLMKRQVRGDHAELPYDDRGMNNGVESKKARRCPERGTEPGICPRVKQGRVLTGGPAGQPRK